MQCKFCGAELMPGTSFCVKCGRNNEEPVVETAETGADADGGRAKRKTKKTVNLKAILIPAVVVIVVIIAVVILLAVPASLHAAYESGTYDECISVSFSASEILPVGKGAEVYVSEDGGAYELDQGEQYYLNQSDTYSYSVYTVNSMGVKSAEKQYEYVLNVPKPAALQVSVQPGTYTDYQDVDIISSDDSTIYYTTDGTTPTEGSPAFQKTIHLENGTTVIKALAVNSAGTRGDVCEWKYELQLPIPSEVSYSMESGVYYGDLELEMSSDSDTDIYYTLDGTIPTKNSDLYTEPIRLGNGIYTVKAMAVNGYDMTSEETEAHYAVTRQKFGMYQKTAVADYYYGVIGGQSILVRYNGQMNEMGRYDIDNIISIYSDGTNLYYLTADGSLCRLNQQKESGTKLIDMNIDNFAVINQTIFFVSSRVLYASDLSGENIRRIDDMLDCDVLGCWEGEFYCWNDGSIYTLVDMDSEPEKVGVAESHDCFVKEDQIYFLDDDGNLVCTDREGGSKRTILAAQSEYYNLDPSFELINVSDKSETIITTYQEIFVCNNTLYVRESTLDQYEEYHIMSKTTDVESSSSGRWLAVDLETENITDTGITVPCITVFDDRIIDSLEQQTQIIE